MKRCIASSKKSLKAKRVSHFRAYWSSINRTTPIVRVWNMVRKLSYTSGVRYHSVLPDFQTYCALLEKFTSPLPIAETNPTPVPSGDHIRFSIDELEVVPINRKDSATGIDKLSFSMISHLPKEGKNWFLNFLNECLLTGIIPSEWKKVIIHPIRKPNKPKEDINSYRPISLLPCPRKIMEHLIKNKLRVSS